MASAGEVNGNGDDIPGTTVSLSICAFSGQNDEPEAPLPKGGRVQNFGHVLKVVKSFGRSKDDLKATGEYPGFACNGDHGFLSGGGGGEP
ncbi:hypothetical protein [Cellulomonas sp. Leaf395]|uniref:hypothetical protein n=1 Tax=Cellulomonas sp. Leaf395 TaxID=1736362 RepID=UPI0006FFB3D8|nr:hypothetical protein [Cellulomonas sp. Leaf395]KQS97315.1 hypothetical protein ASG23_17355 [Cellulomonas sp. Leaf395]